MKATSKKKAGKWYILSNNSQFEVCSTVSSDINGLLAGISDFNEDIVWEMDGDSGGISSHDGTAKATRTVIIVWNPQHQQFFHPSVEKIRVVAYTLFKR